MNMFYSQCLLSKKNPLRNIWIAAHFHKKLTKQFVQLTNISSSVDEIVVDDVPEVTCRILGYLLFGVVRIYSKKVEYLDDDCRRLLLEISDFPVKSKKATVPNPVKILGLPISSSFTLPQTFELDAFDLQVPDNSTCKHVKSRQDITLHGETEENWSVSFGEQQFEDDPDEENITQTPMYELCSADPVMEKLRDNRLASNDPFDPSILDAKTDQSNWKNIYCEDSDDDVDDDDDPNQKNMKNILEMIMSSVENEKISSTSGDRQLSITVDVTSDERFSLEDILILDERDEDIYFSQKPVARINDETNGKKIFDETNQTSISEMMTSSFENEMIPYTSENCQVTITVDVTPNTKIPNASVPSTLDLIAVRTPATKDRSRVSKKRKIMFDDIIVIPNDVLMEGLNDSSDLICKRKKAPHTSVHFLKAGQITTLPQTFFETFIPCMFSDQQHITSEKKTDSSVTVETVETNLRTDEFVSPRKKHKSPEMEETIAPSTPNTEQSSLRYIDMRASNFPNKGPSISLESSEKHYYPSIEQDFDLSFINEELSSFEGDSGENHQWSVKTRSVASYLYKNFTSTNREKKIEDKTLNLSELLKGKTKKESARLFYEILVLKNGEYVDVKQEDAYDDIIMTETDKLRKACADDDVEQSVRRG